MIKVLLLQIQRLNPKKPEDTEASLYAVPFTEIATELGTSLMKNMVAVGATSAVLDLDINVFEEVVQEIFGKKGQQIVAKNMEAIKAGYDYLKEQIDRRFSIHGT